MSQSKWLAGDPPVVASCYISGQMLNNDAAPHDLAYMDDDDDLGYVTECSCGWVCGWQGFTQREAVGEWIEHHDRMGIAK